MAVWMMLAAAGAERKLARSLVGAVVRDTRRFSPHARLSTITSIEARVVDVVHDAKTHVSRASLELDCDFTNEQPLWLLPIRCLSIYRSTFR